MINMYLNWLPYLRQKDCKGDGQGKCCETGQDNNSNLKKSQQFGQNPWGVILHPGSANQKTSTDCNIKWKDA
jgi:hypothetical protein